MPLWRTLEQRMRAKGLGSFARQLVKQLFGIKSVGVILPVLGSTMRTELHLPVVATPEPATAQLNAYLGLRLSKGPRTCRKAVVVFAQSFSTYVVAPMQSCAGTIAVRCLLEARISPAMRPISV